jgi:ATP-dependent Clp protease ATP-binding subunit ClpA
MFGSITKKFKDMRTISALCLTAEKLAVAEGQKQPGAEHFMLAAFDLPDGTARGTLARLRANPDELRQAIQLQYADALRSIGIEGIDAASGSDNPPVCEAQKKGLYNAQPSGQAIIQGLAAAQKHDRETPLLGAHVLLVIAEMQFGVAVRALQKMGIDLAELCQEAQKEIQSYRRTTPA